MSIDTRIQRAIDEAAAVVVASWPPLSEQGRADLAYLAGKVDVSAPVSQVQPMRRAA